MCAIRGWRAGRSLRHLARAQRPSALRPALGICPRRRASLMRQVSRARRPGAAEVAACFQEVERLPALVITGAKDRRAPRARSEALPVVRAVRCRL